MKILLSSEEVNILIYRYLLENGFIHSAFVFNAEANIQNNLIWASHGHKLFPNALVSFLQKALLYLWIEFHTAEEGNDEIPCNQTFSFFRRHDCWLNKDSELGPETPGGSIGLKKKSLDDASTPTGQTNAACSALNSRQSALRESRSSWKISERGDIPDCRRRESNVTFDGETNSLHIDEDFLLGSSRTGGARGRGRRGQKFSAARGSSVKRRRLRSSRRAVPSNDVPSEYDEDNEAAMNGVADNDPDYESSERGREEANYGESTVPVIHSTLDDLSFSVDHPLTNLTSPNAPPRGPLPVRKLKPNADNCWAEEDVHTFVIQPRLSMSDSGVPSTAEGGYIIPRLGEFNPQDPLSFVVGFEGHPFSLFRIPDSSPAKDCTAISPSALMGCNMKFKCPGNGWPTAPEGGTDCSWSSTGTIVALAYSDGYVYIADRDGRTQHVLPPPFSHGAGAPLGLTTTSVGSRYLAQSCTCASHGNRRDKDDVKFESGDDATCKAHCTVRINLADLPYSLVHETVFESPVVETMWIGDHLAAVADHQLLIITPTTTREEGPPEVKCTERWLTFDGIVYTARGDPEGNYLAIVEMIKDDDSAHVKVWDLVQETFLAQLELAQPPIALEWISDGDDLRLITITWRGDVSEWCIPKTISSDETTNEPPTLKVASRSLQFNDSGLTCAAYSRHTDTLVLGGTDQLVRVIRLPSWTHEETYALSDAVSHIAINSENYVLAFTNKSECGNLWKLQG